MATICCVDVQFIAALITIAVPFVILAIYLMSRRITRGYYGINKVYMSPPFVSATMATEAVGGFASSENSTGLSSPVIICIPCTLVNTDIFPEIIRKVGLTIQHDGNRKEFHFQVMKISQDLEIFDQEGRLKPASYFEELILNRGQEKRLNFFFYARPPLNTHLEEATLGKLQIGTYKLTLEFEKKKFLTRITRTHMAFEIVQSMQDSFKDQKKPSTIVLIKGEFLRELP